MHLKLFVKKKSSELSLCLNVKESDRRRRQTKRKGHCVCVACIFFFFMHVHKHVLLADRLEGLRTSLDKQTSCLPHLFTSYSHNYMCSLRNHSDNRSTVPQKQKYRIVKQLIGQLLVYFTALLVQICITLHLPLLVIVRGWQGLESFSFYFCLCYDKDGVY